VKAEESEGLLLDRWSRVEEVIRDHGRDPITDVVRDKLVVTLRAHAALRPDATTPDLYIFRLDFMDYDSHAPSIWLCNPEDPTQTGQGQQYYPKLNGAGSGVFAHPNFLCMPGDRRCYDAGHHAEWKKLEYYHPEFVVESLLLLLRSTDYQGRM